MRKMFTLVAVLGFMVCTSQLGAQVGSSNMTAGTLSRVTLLRIVPGQADMFWQDLRQHSLPLWEEQKRRGLITDYSVSTKSTRDNPDDWNVAIEISYKNWGALDGIGTRMDSISRAHYGTVEARTAASAARLPYSVTVSSFLMRNQTLNPWK